MKRFIRMPSPAMAVALVALFVAMAGTSYAAVRITGKEVANGSLTGADVRNGTLAGVEIKNGALASRDVKDGSLLAADFKSGQLPGGAKGDKGDQGDRGPRGQAGGTTRWALVNEQGVIQEQSGGFTVVSRPGINGQPATNPNIYINSGGSLIGKGLSVSTAIQNQIDRTGDMTADPAFTGDIAVGRCNSAGTINCVPTGTNNDNTLVVRSLADNTDATSQTRRFYVEVTP